MVLNGPIDANNEPLFLRLGERNHKTSRVTVKKNYKQPFHEGPATNEYRWRRGKNKGSKEMRLRKGENENINVPS